MADGMTQRQATLRDTKDPEGTRHKEEEQERENGYIL